MYTNFRIQMRFPLQTSHVLYLGIVPVYIYHALRLAQAMQRVATSEIAELVRRALTRHGLANDMAECVAKVVTAAERDECRRGHDRSDAKRGNCSDGRQGSGTRKIRCSEWSYAGCQGR